MRLSNSLRLHARGDDVDARSVSLLHQAADALDSVEITHETDEDVEAREILEHKEMRDRFALAVLPEVHRQASPDASVESIANACYVIADAMITRRQA